MCQAVLSQYMIPSINTFTCYNVQWPTDRIWCHLLLEPLAAAVDFIVSPKPAVRDTAAAWGSIYC